MQRLSSSFTPFTKFLLPGGFLAAWPAWLFQIQDPRFGYLPAFFWTVACAFLLWWTLPIKKVSLCDGQFLISNYRREIRVPAAQLVKIREDRWNRTPNIALFFDPPTAFGRKIRIVPPYMVWSSREYNRVVQLLRGIIEENGAPNQAPLPTPVSVTPAADAPVAPAPGAAEL
jgi:hypothetical protein